MRDLSELNINEGGRPVDRPAPSPALIERFEREFGLTLPEDLLALLRHSNGGHPELAAFFPDGGSGYVWAVDGFLHLTPDEESTEGFWWNARAWRPILGSGALPFASTGGGDVFFLDLARTPASVCVTVHDEGDRIVLLAPSLAAFLDRLALDPDWI